MPVSVIGNADPEPQHPEQESANAELPKASLRPRISLFDIPYKFQRPWHFFAVFLTVMLIELVPLPVAAQPPREANEFRGLRPGYEITVLAASSRRTDVAVDDQPEVSTETSEAIQIQYRVVGLDPSGDLAVRAFIQSVDRQPTNMILSRLKVAPILLNIQTDGKVRTLNAASRESLLMNLSNGDPESIQVLRKCLTDETIAAWFSVPFWMLRPADGDDIKRTWERSHEVSLGTLGSLQMDLSFRADTPENSFAKVAIAGEARFRPLVLPDTQAAEFPFLSHASVEIDEISGTGQVFVVSPDGAGVPPQRPEFESVEWLVRLHGDAQLPLTGLETPPVVPNPVDTDPSTQDVPGKTGRISFRLTQRHVWTLQHFSTGISEIFDRNRTTIPE